LVKWDVGFGWFWAVNVVEHKIWSLDMFRNRFESKSACRWSWLEGPSFSGIVEASCRKRCRIGQDFPNGSCGAESHPNLRWGKPGGRWSNLSANPAQHSTPDILNLNWSVAVQNPWHSTRNCTSSPNIQNFIRISICFLFWVFDGLGGQQYNWESWTICRRRISMTWPDFTGFGMRQSKSRTDLIDLYRLICFLTFVLVLEY
jgi:hypothetical protein